ncbi:MAG: hypothetical protein IKR94_00135, partial [Bacteroidales bacterium]|nr:hypothetical protein [Bacteroidales bacterium]
MSHESDIQNHCRNYLPHFGNNADEPSTLQHQRKLLLLIDKYEDQGYGECFLRNDNVAQIVKDNLMFHNGKKYNLLCWCIMPNHVHVLVEMF